MEDRDVTLDNGWGPFPVALGSVPEANKMVAAGKAGEIFKKKKLRNHGLSFHQGP